MGPAVGEVNAVAAHGGDSGLDDVVGHLVDGPVGVDDDEALGLGLSQDEELLAQGGAEGVPLLLEAWTVREAGERAQERRRRLGSP